MPGSIHVQSLSLEALRPGSRGTTRYTYLCTSEQYRAAFSGTRFCGSLSNSLRSFRGPRSAVGPAGRIRVTAEVSGDPKMSLVRELAGDIRADKEEEAVHR